MIRRLWGVLLIAAVGVGGLTGVGCGQQSNEVVIKGPTEAEREAQMQKLTPEQREVMEKLKDVIPRQTPAQETATPSQE